MSHPSQNQSGSNNTSLAKSDRYVSFIGMDCDAKAEHLMEHINRHIDDPEKTNVFWEYFKKKAAGGSGPKPDALFLIHSNLNQIRELFEEHADSTALELLDQIEEEFC